MPVQRVSQVELDSERLPAGDEPPRDHQEGLQEAEENDQRDEDPQSLFVVSEEGLVDDLSGEPRNHEPGRLRRDRETDRDSE